MSEENVEIVREAYEVFSRMGIEEILGRFHPECEVVESPAFPDERIFKGHDGVRRWVGLYLEIFDRLRVEPIEMIDDGDLVVAVLRIFGIGKGSITEVELPGTHVATVQGQKLTRLQIFLEKADALEAAGLSE